MTTYAPLFDPAAAWEEMFVAAFKDTPCDAPIWSPLTDDALMAETIRVLERRNIIGVLSGPPDRVLRWFKAAPDRFVPSVQL